MANSELQIKIQAVDNASKALKSIQSGIIRLVGAAVALSAALKAVTYPAQAAAEFEREMVNVAKTTNFSQSQIEGLSDTLLELSKSMSTSAAELAAIAATAGQLGLGSFGVDAIAAFTESVAKASVTLGLSTEAAAEFGAQISSIFNLDPSNIENVFSVLNELSNTSVATAGQIADIVKRIGSVGGVTLEQSAALAAFFRDLGVQVEVAGTSTVKVLSNMSAKADKFAKVMKISTREWLELMQKDTVNALTLVTTKLYEMDRAQRDATAKELFGGGRILATFTKLIDEAGNGYERLYRLIDSANSSFSSGTSSIEEYEKVMTSLSEQSKVMGNAIKAIAIEMGDNLTPSILRAVRAFTTFVNSDAGADFFLQISDSLKEMINGLIDAGSYLASFGNTWSRVFDAGLAAVKALLAISVAKFFLGMVNAVASVGTSMKEVVTWSTLLTKSSYNTAKAYAAEAKAAQTVTSAVTAKDAAASKSVGLSARMVAIATELGAATHAQALAEKELLAAQNAELPSIAAVNSARTKLAATTAALTAAETRYTEAALAGSVARAKAAQQATIASAVQNLGALGTRPFANISKTAQVATKSVGFLSKAVNVLKFGLGRLFTFITGPIGVAISLIAIFYDDLVKLLNLPTKSKKDLDIEQNFRIDERKARKKYEAALRTLNDIGNDVADRAGLEIKVPVSTATELDKVAFVNQITKDLQDAAKAVNASKVVQDTIKKEISKTVNEFDYNLKLNVAYDAGDYEAIIVKDIGSKLDKATKELDNITKSQGISLNNYISGVSEYVEKLKDRIDDLKNKYAEAKKEFEKGFTIDIQAMSASELDKLRTDMLSGAVKGTSDVTNETLDALKLMVEKKKELAKLAREQFLYEKEVKTNAEAIANAAGLQATKQVAGWTEGIRELEKTLADVREKKFSSTTNQKDDKILKQERDLVREINRLEGIRNEYIGSVRIKSIQEGLKGLTKQDLATVQITNHTLDNIKANEKNKRTLGEIATAQAESLAELINKRAILNEQLKQFDNYSRDALQLAGKMDGAFDNINKTTRAMHRSLDDYSKSIDEILRKKAISASTDKFNLGIDKTLKDDIYDINQYYDQLIANAKQLAKDTGEPLDPEFLKIMKERRDLEIEEAKKQAEQIKLAEARKVAESEVTRALKEQEATQNQVAAVIDRIKKAQEAGGYKGADGIKQYADDMIALEKAQYRMAASSDTAKNALADLANTDGVDATKVRGYKEQLIKLGEAGIDVRRSQIELGKSLADNTKSLAEAERSKISSVYDKTNEQINSMIEIYPQLIKLEEAMTVEANKTASGLGAMAGSMGEIIAKIGEMQKTGDVFSTLIQGSDKFSDDLRKLKETMAGGFASDKVEVGFAVSEQDLTTMQQTIKDALKVSDAEIDTTIKVTKVLNKDGSEQFVFEKVKIDPDGEKLANSVEVTIAGQSYTIVANEKAMRKSIEEALKREFKVNVNASVTSNAAKLATGGSVRGAGTGTSDSILSWLSNGEYVIRAASVAKFGAGFFDMINAGILPKFASGGLATASASTSSVDVNRDVIDLNFNVGNNTYKVNGERDQIRGLVKAMKYLQGGSK